MRESIKSLWQRETGRNRERENEWEKRVCDKERMGDIEKERMRERKKEFVIKREWEREKKFVINAAWEV